MLQHDRGSVYGEKDVRTRLAREMTVALISRVHTPTDNPLAEHANRELKEEADLGKGVVLRSDEEAASRLERAHGCLRIRPRASRGFRTAEELDREMARADARGDSKAFYEEACSAVEQAVLGLADPEEIQKAEQDAIWRTLERHGLARLHVGRHRRPCSTLPPVATAAQG